jgi:hypothetical protein
MFCAYTDLLNKCGGIEPVCIDAEGSENIIV